jgi:hypothetical protein
MFFIHSMAKGAVNFNLILNLDLVSAKKLRAAQATQWPLKIRYGSRIVSQGVIRISRTASSRRDDRSR